VETQKGSHYGMIHARSLAELPAPERPALLTIGSFDGVHLGHQALIGKLVQTAHAQNYQAAVVTFFPHPAVVLRGPRPAFNLTSPEEKAEQFEQLGVDVLLTHPFTIEVSQLTAQQFIEPLQAAFNFSELWAGADFAFGHNREGNVDWLLANGYKVNVVEPVRIGEEVVSSSRIRRGLTEGNIEDANTCLGRPFSITGTVVEGNKRGRTIGIPTANLQLWEGHAFPAHGVYAGHAWVNGVPVQAVTNIGVRPTFGGDTQTFIEAHLLDFDADLYGQNLKLDFLARLRSEKKFNGIQELVAQIHTDIANARELFAARLEIGD
jgi:riboflavin kinase/FMN adenylyltransferase